MKRTMASRDLRIADLPKTRKEQFGDIIKHRYLLLLGLGGLLLLFAVPLLVSLGVRDYMEFAIVGNGGEDQAIIAAMNSIKELVFLGTTLVSFLVLSVGLSGTLHVLRLLIHGEPIFLKEDFLSGIKENAKQFLIFTLIGWAFAALSGIVGLLFENAFLQAAPIAVNYGLVFPLVYFAFFLTSFYKNDFPTTVRTSIALYFQFFPAQFGLFVSVAFLSLISLIPLSIFYIRYAILILGLLLICPLSLLGSYLYQVNLYDDLINKDQFAEIYRKGLFGKDKIKK